MSSIYLRGWGSLAVPVAGFPPSQLDVGRGMFAAARTDCESTIAAIGSGEQPSH
ncbi:hypothetical protein [Streptomyces sp. NPDC004270]